MQVSEITGSSNNPNIWQFFVAVVGLNTLIFILLFVSDFLTRMKNDREIKIKMEGLTKYAKRSGTGFALPKWTVE